MHPSFCMSFFVLLEGTFYDLLICTTLSSWSWPANNMEVRNNLRYSICRTSSSQATDYAFWFTVLWVLKGYHCPLRNLKLWDRWRLVIRWALQDHRSFGIIWILLKLISLWIDSPIKIKKLQYAFFWFRHQILSGSLTRLY